MLGNLWMPGIALIAGAALPGWESGARPRGEKVPAARVRGRECGECGGGGGGNGRGRGGGGRGRSRQVGGEGRPRPRALQEGTQRGREEPLDRGPRPRGRGGKDERPCILHHGSQARGPEQAEAGGSKVVGRERGQPGLQDTGVLK